ncbi:MAG: sensor histidine kinase, partial [Candidatus Limnocylindria bacterium]
GQYRARVAASGPREVRELGGAFNEMADEIERARGSEHAFLADISHELRTPLTSIGGFAQAIAEGEVKGEGVGWAANVIRRESRRLARLVEGLLQVARLQAGTLLMTREPVALERVLYGAIAALEVQAHDAGVALEPDLPSLPPVHGDVDRLAQLFLNVLDNAVRHSPAGSAVAVRAAAEDGEVVVRVRDHGSGLPEGAETRLFERFYRGENAADGGAGLGLAIAQAIAHGHGGRIHAQNVAGGGAEFSVHLPTGGPANVR